MAEFTPWLPPNGTMAQLWYLPWAFVWCVMLALLFFRRRPDISSPLGTVIWTLATAAGGVGCMLVWEAGHLPTFWNIFVLYSPSILAGCLLFALRHQPRHMIAAGLVLSIVGLVMQITQHHGADQFLIAVPIFVASHFIRLRPNPMTRKLGALSMDIYLCHVLIIALTGKLLGSDVHTMVGAFVALALSICFAIALRITGLAKYIT